VVYLKSCIFAAEKKKGVLCQEKKQTDKKFTIALVAEFAKSFGHCRKLNVK